MIQTVENRSVSTRAVHSVPRAGLAIITAAALLMAVASPIFASAGKPAAAKDTGRAAPRSVTVQVMKHNCANVMTEAQFLAVEARAATNPTTPAAAFGKTVETVLECPTVVLSGETQTPGAVAGGTSSFDFSVTGGGAPQTLSADGTFAQAAACETDVSYDANRNGTLDANVCLDLSHHAFTVNDGTITVTETSPPTGFAFGAVRFTPGSGDEASLVSAANGTIVLDTTNDADGMIMMHVYNFSQAAAPVPTPQPTASALPNAALSDSRGSGSPIVPLAAILAAVAAAGVGLRLARQRNR